VKGSPFESTFPSVIFLSEESLPWLYIRMKAGVNPHDALPKIQSAFINIVPSAPFDYQFADEEYATKFRAEERVGKLAIVFSVLAILISCSGLFGLASFVAEQRTKEVGIRKVMGATITDIWELLSREFVLLVVVASAMAIPFSYWFMEKWLVQYEYRTTISWFVFAISATGAMVITIVTVSFQAIRAATLSPVSSLKSE
jgi:putative ABC transport system permease protein